MSARWRGRTAKVPTAWTGAQEAFPIWYAKEQGWDKETGPDVEMLHFNSGMDALNPFPAKTWGHYHHDRRTCLIANCNDEAAVNAVMVRADSPIMDTKLRRRETRLEKPARPATAIRACPSSSWRTANTPTRTPSHGQIPRHPYARP